MKLRTKIVDWLYRKYGSKDLVGMTRQQMFGVNLNNGELILEELPEEEKNYISSSAKLVLSEPVFKMAIDLVKEKFMRHARDVANNELEMFCDRFSINGAAMVEEQIKYLSELKMQKETPTELPFELME